MTAADRQAVGIKENGSDAGLSSFLASALEADVSAIFVERNGKIEVSLRACPGFSVSEAAWRSERSSANCIAVSKSPTSGSVRRGCRWPPRAWAVRNVRSTWLGR